MNYIATTDIHHYCSVIRRKLEGEYKNFSILFVTHKSGERHKTIIDKKGSVELLTFGRKIYKTIIKHESADHNETEFMGLVVNHNLFQKMLRIKHFTAVCYINVDEYANSEELKHAIHRLTWFALSEYLYQNKHLLLNKLPSYPALIHPDYSDLIMAQMNILADIFCAFINEINGDDEYIYTLAKKRARQALTKSSDNSIQFYPFFAIHDACKFIVMDNLSDYIDTYNYTYQQIFDLSQEILETYGEECIYEWKEFCIPAQKMLWQGYSTAEILGSAIHFSKNDHTRILSYRIAEILEIEPASFKYGYVYNLFCDKEKLETMHTSLAAKTGKKVIQTLLRTRSVKCIEVEQEKLNLQLLLGKGCGWCSYALEDLKDFYLKNKKANENQLFEIYIQSFLESSWQSIDLLSQQIFSNLSEDHNFNISDLNALLAQNDLADDQFIKDYFKYLSDIDFEKYMSGDSDDATLNVSNLDREEQILNFDDDLFGTWQMNNDHTDIKKSLTRHNLKAARH